MRGDTALAYWLRDAGVDCIFGVVGIPVVELASECQKVGIRFYAFHNEQAASYAAATFGYLTGKPGVCLCVSGPGVVHSLAGVAHAAVNKWPMVLLGGSHKAIENYRGAFQEAPISHSQMTSPFTKATFTPSSPAHLRYCLTRALATAVSVPAGPSYIELPENLLVDPVAFRDLGAQLQRLLPTPALDSAESPDLPYAQVLQVLPPVPDATPCLCPALPSTPVAFPVPAAVAAAARTIARAVRPLVIVGKGACFAGAEGYLRIFIERLNLPCLPSPMARGIISDTHPLCVAAARSQALSRADCVVIVGARMNWMFAFANVLSGAPAIVHVDCDPAELAYLAERAQQGKGVLCDAAGGKAVCAPFLAASGDIVSVSASPTKTAAAASVPASAPMLHSLVGDCAATLYSLSVAMGLTAEPFVAPARNPDLEEQPLTSSGAGEHTHTVTSTSTSAREAEGAPVSPSALSARWASWVETLTATAHEQRRKLVAKTTPQGLPTHVVLPGAAPVPLDSFVAALAPFGAPPPAIPHLSYDLLLGALGRMMPPCACLVTEGANSMDKARLHVPSFLPRRRLDATTFAAMGPALGAVVAAVAAYGVLRPVVCVVGDSSLGFSAMEIETLARYRLPVLIVVVNNNGIYSGSRARANALPADATTPELTPCFSAAPKATAAVLVDSAGASSSVPTSAPVSPHAHADTGSMALRVPATALSPALRYDALARALGAHPRSCLVASLPAFVAAVQEGVDACVRDRLPVVVNALITPEGTQAKLRSSDAFFGKGKTGDRARDAKL